MYIMEYVHILLDKIKYLLVVEKQCCLIFKPHVQSILSGY